MEEYGYKERVTAKEVARREAALEELLFDFDFISDSASSLIFPSPRKGKK